MAADSIERVLIVDDDPAIGELAGIALQAVGGMAVLAVDSGPEALRVVRGFRPDVILLDVMMPDMAGPEVVAHLQAIPEVADVPIVYASALADTDSVYNDPRVAGVIAKPFVPSRLRADLLEILGADRRRASA